LRRFDVDQYADRNLVVGIMGRACQSDERNPAAGELRRGKGSKMKKETLNIYEKPEGNKPTR
jgi:hypothetical protein